MKITIVIPTHNPNAERLRRTLGGLSEQTLSPADWELILVDNESTPPLAEKFVASHLVGSFRIVREETLGLSHARRRGILEAKTELIVFCDDDNVLAPDYLEMAWKLMSEHPDIGVAGGKSLPSYDSDPPSWYAEGMAPLGCRDLGEKRQVLPGSEYLSEKSYPDFAPIGAGMVFRKSAISRWLPTVGVNGVSDRKGDSLSSAGDCDIVLHALDAGWAVAYWPDIVLHHLLPENRLTPEYLGAISRTAFRDFIMVLDLHGIRPWRPIPSWTLPLRKAKAWIRNRPWTNPEAFVQWSSAAGNLEGRSSIRRKMHEPA